MRNIKIIVILNTINNITYFLILFKIQNLWLKEDQVEEENVVEVM